MWTEKYRPKKIDEMIGNEEVRLDVIRWLRNWRKGQAALLVGPPGTGKTTFVHLLAKEFGFNLVELNASDTRTKAELDKRIGEVASSTSLLAEKSIIFLDEVDGLAGRADFGAIDFISDLIKKSENPVIMAANDPESEQVKKISNFSRIFRFKSPPPRELELYLRMIIHKEGLQANKESITLIIKAANGDIRYAINSLQSDSLSSKDIEMTTAQSITSFLDAYDIEGALRALHSYPGQPRQKVRDIFASVVRSNLDIESKRRALEILSRVDILLGAIARSGEWRLLRYIDTILATELKSVVDRRVIYVQNYLPWELQLRIWNDSKKIKELASACSMRLRTSQKSALIQDIPYIFTMCKDSILMERMIKSLNLSDEYIGFLERESRRVRQ